MATTPHTDLHAPPMDLSATLGADEQRAELEQARHLAERYRLEFIDMDTFRIDQELFRSIPAELMLRYGFVPYRRDGKVLEIVVPDPTVTLSGVASSTASSSIIGRSLGSETTITSVLPSRR